MAKASFTSILRGSLLFLMSGLTVALPSVALADAGNTSTTPVITPSSSSQIIQPPASSASPNSGLPSPPSSGSSSGNSNAPKTTGFDANPIQARPDIQARPPFKDRL